MITIMEALLNCIIHIQDAISILESSELKDFSRRLYAIQELSGALYEVKSHIISNEIRNNRDQYMKKIEESVSNRRKLLNNKDHE